VWNGLTITGLSTVREDDLIYPDGTFLLDTLGFSFNVAGGLGVSGGHWADLYSNPAFGAG
jgi:hypothetical protein